MEKKKLNFFARVKIALFKLESYVEFVEENVSKSVKYFFTIALIVACFLSGISASRFLKMFKKGVNHVRENVPEFSYANGELIVNEYSEGYDEDYQIGFIADTSEDLNDEKINEYKKKLSNAGILFLKDKMMYISGGETVEYLYKESFEDYNVNEFSKGSFFEKIDSISDAQIVIVTFILCLTIIYLAEIITIFSDWLVIAVFAWCISKICNVGLKFKSLFNISIYALTLPLFLTIIYELANYAWGFYTDYFRLVYLLISYVYVIAAILMMKSDVIKQTAVVGKIETESQKDSEEEKDSQSDNEEHNENKDDSKADNNEENKKDDTKEPDGSEI